MNYLGHLVLSPSTPHIRAGNFVTDWLDITALHQLPLSIQQGVELHRAIDTFTDRHPAVRQITSILRPTLKKYSPVGTDLVLDFLLAHHWYRYHNCSFSDFCSDMYRTLMEASRFLPDPIDLRIRKMVKYQWLNKAPISSSWTPTLINMDKRARFPSKFHEVKEKLLSQFSLFRVLFEAFYEDAMQHFPSPYHRKNYIQDTSPQNSEKTKSSKS